MSKVYTIGEALIDFVPDKKGIRLKSVEQFRRVPGGAPANVAVAVAKLGGDSGFIGKVGQDAFGELIIDTLKQNRVDVSRLRQTDEANTALAFVSLSENGDRDFAFYRNPSADMLLTPDEIGDFFQEGDILHFCSVDLIEAPVKYAHIRAIEQVRAKNGLVSFDPNIRLPLWKDPGECRKTVLQFLSCADLLKISEEEIEFVFETKDENRACCLCFERGIKAIFITRGKDGASVIHPDFKISAPALDVTVADTTGAGDAFAGACLFMLQKAGSLQAFLRKDYLGETLKFASAAGSLTTTKTGAIDALPDYETVASCL